MVGGTGEVADEGQTAIFGHRSKLPEMLLHHKVGVSPLLRLSFLLGSVERGPTLVWPSETDYDTAEWDQMAEEMLTRLWISRQDTETSRFLYCLLYLTY